MNSALQVRMLGGLSLRRDGREISDSSNRSRKAWLLLAYMICRRGQSVTNGELSGLLWKEDTGGANQLNALKTLFHRVRSFLNELGEDLGREYIIRRDGRYAWNTALPLTLDIDEFDALCKAGAAAGDEEEKLEAWGKALDLYQGDFLARLSSALWVIPIAAYYHSLYVRTALSTLALLQKRGRLQEMTALCRQALRHEPYQEEFLRYLLRALLDLGNRREAAAEYEQRSEALFSDLGVMPAEDLRAMYREAVSTVYERAAAPSEILEQLREPPGADGALLCEYDAFRVMCRAVARAVERSGDAVHLVLLSVCGADGEELPRHSLDRVMANLQPIILTNLRRGDAAARCSVSQFVLMLLQANYENSQGVCTRMTKAFVRQYPHSPACLRFSVHPLEPAGNSFS